MPETQYAKTHDGIHVAYQVVGDGPQDLVFANSWCSHVEVSWDNPRIGRFYEHLASFCRLLLFDKRGTGLSDPMVSVPTMEERIDDIRAVMDAVKSDRAVVFGTSEGAATAALFAATYPDRTQALVMFSPFIVGVADEECPWAWTPEYWELVLGVMEGAWGTPDGSGVEIITPSLIGNQAAKEWYGRYFRAAASPAAAATLLKVNTQIDMRPVLPTIRVPTLVMHRADEIWINVNYGRYAAAKIPGARLGRDGGHGPLPLGAERRYRRRGDRGVPDRRAVSPGDRSGAGDGAVHRHRELHIRGCSVGRFGLAATA
jgi:pimeloyl-ACP methyl ester carboxylesterase